MPMKPVEFEQSHQIQKPGNGIGFKKMPRAVQVLPAPGKSWLILNAPTGQKAIGGDEKIEKGDTGVKDTTVRGSGRRLPPP